MRADDGDDLLAGYVSGPAAATEATAMALVRADVARTVVLVEGVSDQIAVETLARRHGRNLAAEGTVVLPVGGAHGIARYVRRFGPGGTGAHLAGLCDAAEAPVVQRGLTAAGLGAPASRADLRQLGFFVCVEDLEDEFIRAAGPALVTEVFAAHGDLLAFRTIQRQPAWRGKDEMARLRRFLGAGAHRKLRYARLLTEAIPLAAIALPVHLNWSAPGRVFNMALRADRARVYEVVLQEGRPADILAYVDGALLVDLWDDLVLPRAVRAAWSPVIEASRPAAA